MQARACLFFAAVFLMPRPGVLGLPRYDALPLFALAGQAGMLWAKIETWDEAKTIALFHVAGFALEVFKTSAGIRSWGYPDLAYSKLFGVPPFSGFMYAAVGSYIILASAPVRFAHSPPSTVLHGQPDGAGELRQLPTHHYVGDYRWYLGECILGL